MNKKDIEKREHYDYEEPMEDFASSLGSSFGVEVSEDGLTKDEIQHIEEDYVSPHLQKLKETAQEVIEGTLHPKQLKKVVDKIYKELNTTIENFNMTIELPAENNTVLEEIPIISAAFELNKKALDTVKIYFNDGKEEHIHNGINMMQKATNQLNKSFNVITGSIVADYRKSREHVEEGSYLNTVVGQKPAQLKQVVYTTPNYDKLNEAASLITQGKIKDDEFKHRIEEVETNIIKSIEAIDEEKKDIDNLNKEEKTAFLELLKQMNHSLVMFKEGITKMKAYFTSKNSLNLEEGLEVAFEGAQIMGKAYAMGDEIDKAVKNNDTEDLEKEE